MRRVGSAAIAVTLFLSLGGLSSTATLAREAPTEAVQVTGSTLLAGHTSVAEEASSFANVKTDHEALDGCYLLQATGRSEAGSWGTLTVHDGACQYFGSVEGQRITWEGEWFVPGQGPSWYWNLHLLSYPVWLRGRGEYEGSSAVLDFGAHNVELGDYEAWEDGFMGGEFEAWLFPTPSAWHEDR